MTKKEIKTALFKFRNNLLDRFPQHDDESRRHIFEVFAETTHEVFGGEPPAHKRPQTQGSIGSFCVARRGGA